jgi:predicted ATPase
VHLRAFEVAGYRSLRKLSLELAPLTVVAGPNGSGKTNVYRALHLLHAAATGTLAQAVADEGGLPSLLWAGGRQRKERARVELEARWDELGYSLSVGLEPPPTKFPFDPHIKIERVRWEGVELCQRGEGSATARDAEGNRVVFPFSLEHNESILAQLKEPHRFPVLSTLRVLLSGWRFYHHLRSDAEAPSRRPRLGMRTTVLAGDGRDLAAALATIYDIGDGARLDGHVERAFPGSRIEVVVDDRAQFALVMRVPGVQRPLEAGELSDGTLRYLCLVAALLSPRPAPLLVLNEPETSLHPDLFAPLGELILDAATRSQLLVTTHAEPLVARLSKARDVKLVELKRDAAETLIA